MQNELTPCDSYDHLGLFESKACTQDCPMQIKSNQQQMLWQILLLEYQP